MELGGQRRGQSPHRILQTGKPFGSGGLFDHAKVSSLMEDRNGNMHSVEIELIPELVRR